MPTNPFHPSNFDPSQIALNRTVVFDDNGYIDLGGYGNPAQFGYDQPTTDAYIESIFAWNNLTDIVSNVDTQFADATYYIGINSAVSSSQGTTYYIDHGFQGTNGSDVIMDVSGDTVANTGKGADLILLGQGTHFVDSGAGNDVVVVGNGDDVVKLGSGDDWLWANGGNDNVRAGSGNDVVLGLDGDDTLRGGRGEDDLQGGNGRDKLNGGQDNDRLDGGADNDTLTGGQGEDSFIFSAGTGRDIVRDFEDGLDRLEVDMASTGLSGFSDLTLTQQGNHVLVDLGNGDEVLVRNIAQADLTAADFDFV